QAPEMAIGELMLGAVQGLQCIVDSPQPCESAALVVVEPGIVGRSREPVAGGVESARVVAPGEHRSRPLGRSGSRARARGAARQQAGDRWQRPYEAHGRPPFARWTCITCAHFLPTSFPAARESCPRGSFEMASEIEMPIETLF